MRVLGAVLIIIGAALVINGAFAVASEDLQGGRDAWGAILIAAGLVLAGSGAALFTARGRKRT